MLTATPDGYWNKPYQLAQARGFDADKRPCYEFVQFKALVGLCLNIFS